MNDLLAMTTFAPSCDRFWAKPFPSPVAPPVTKATLSLKQPGGNIAELTTGKCLAWSRLCSAGLTVNKERLREEKTCKDRDNYI